MATALPSIPLVLLLCSALGLQLAAGRDSTLTSCSRENSECTYQHRLVCPENTSLAVEGEKQNFDFTILHCIWYGFICSHSCCTGCTVTMTPKVLASLRQQCDRRQNCTADVTRTSVTCGRINEDPFYSDSSTITYRCDQDQSTTSTSTSSTSHDPPRSSQTSDVTTRSIANEVTTNDVNLPTSGEATTAEQDKGGHSTQTSAAPNMAGVVGGAVAGAVTLLAVSVILLLCWRRGHLHSSKKELPHGDTFAGSSVSMDSLDNPAGTNVALEEDGQHTSRNAAAHMDYDHLGAKKSDDVRPRDVTYSHLAANDDADYDHAGTAVKDDVRNNLYDRACCGVTSAEDDYDHAGADRRGDVIDHAYDHVVAGGGAEVTKSTPKTTCLGDPDSPDCDQVPDTIYENALAEDRRM